MGKTALVFGSTGLIGSYLVQWLRKSDTYEKIIIFQRKAAATLDPKSRYVQLDFDKMDENSQLMKGNDVFCCLGTTMHKARSKAVFRKVDYEYPMQIASIARANGVDGYFLVSSVGADARSSNFYLRTKGELERDIQSLGFLRISIFRPSLLLGNRNERRFGERFAQGFYPIFHWLLQGHLKKYRAIPASDVARAMVYVAIHGYESKIVFSDKISEIANKAKCSL
jgi:uncharacterized protein YbjT (DUF2867 family)